MSGRLRALQQPVTKFAAVLRPQTSRITSHRQWHCGERPTPSRAARSLRSGYLRGRLGVRSCGRVGYKSLTWRPAIPSCSKAASQDASSSSESIYRSCASVRGSAPLRTATTTAAFLCALQLLQPNGGRGRSIIGRSTDTSRIKLGSAQNRDPNVADDCQHFHIMND